LIVEQWKMDELNTLPPIQNSYLFTVVLEIFISINIYDYMSVYDYMGIYITWSVRRRPDRTTRTTRVAISRPGRRPNRD
jgi:hypothetical protein